MIRRLVLGVLLGVVLAGCGGDAVSTGAPATAGSVAPSETATADRVDLEVYAASSLKAVMAKVGAAYTTANPGTTISVSTDSSAALATKIEQGAAPDVFLSADMAQPLRIIGSGFAAGRPTPFAANLLAIIVPTDNPGHIERPTDLARPGVKIIAAGRDVPITRYATQLVANLAKEAGSPAGFASAYESNVVSEEDNVAGIVGKIALGEGDAGIVYVTDAKGSDKVTMIEVPATANVPAAYAGVVLLGSRNRAAASSFLRWLAGPEGQDVLAGFGFLRLTS